MNIIIKKNGKQVMELAQDNGICAIVKRYENGMVYTVISVEKFASILDRADEGDYDIFDYDF